MIQLQHISELRIIFEIINHGPGANLLSDLVYPETSSVNINSRPALSESLIDTLGGREDSR